ncbi:hypothetical protein BN1723_007822, partial [Verticillium longisporum]
MDPNRDAQDDPAPAQRRPRAPTITIDTTAATSTPDVPHDARANLGASPTSPQEDAISPSTVVDPAAAQWIASQNMLAAQDPHARPELRAETSFDSRDSRPRSPHNVSSPITARGNDRAFLSVPTTARSRQNSVDDDVDTSRSFVSSQGDTLAVSGSNAEKTGFHSHHLSNDKLMKDDTALQPDQGKEGDFQVDNNPFAFSPGQLNKLLNPKSLAAFYKIGGLAGLEKGVQSDRKAGLSIEENTVPQHVTYEQATSHLALKSDGSHKEDVSAAPARPHPAAGGDGSFVDRKRVFKDNRLPEKKGKSLLQLMWITYQDKVLMLLTAAAVVSLAIGIYQSVGGEHKEGESRVEWVEGVAIVAAIVIVVVVGSLNDYSKERQFAKLNKKKQDRDVKVVRSGKIMEISVYDILVGDVVHLEPGDLVPVDGLLIEGFNVKCDESQATGESDIIKKKAAADVFAAIENHEDVKKMDPFILSGARVMEGVGTFMVTSTGVNSTYGQTLMALNEDPEVTPLQSKLNIIAEYIAKLGGAADKNEIHFEDLFRNMVFVGMVGIQDPLREGVPEAVRTCQGAGVCVRMVTGDNKITAQAIAKECGILQPHSVVMEGPEFRNLTKYEQMEILPRLHVLARSSPEDKRILVKRLKEQGEIVAVTGDGTNDAPALKTADVGFSMGIAGTEVAKEASAIILMDDNFNSIVKALMWGRAVNDAVKRFLQFQLTVNITAVVLTFVTSVSSNGGEGAVSVLTAVQLLWVNLIMDTLAALALATDPPQKSVLLRKPERRNASIISTTMWKMIIGQAIYQLAITFMLFYGYDHLDLVKNEMNLSPERFEAQVRTLVFNTFVWMQIFNQWNNRRLDNRFNIFEGLTQNYFFVAISSIMIGGQILIIFVGGAALSIAPDKQTALMWGIAIVLGFLSIPFGIVIRLIPDEFVERLIPDYLKRKSKESGPKLTVDDEEFGQYPEALADVRDELTFLKRMKGGRLNNLKFAVQHPRETFVTYSRSPTHSRSNS